MLATLNPKQIVDEIVKDTVKDNDPHDAIQISPDIVLASRPISVAPALAPDIATRPEPKFVPEPKASFERKISLEPGSVLSQVAGGTPALCRHRHPRRRERWCRSAEAIRRRQVAARRFRHVSVRGRQCGRHDRLGATRRRRQADARRMDTGIGVAAAVDIADRAGRCRAGRTAHGAGGNRSNGRSICDAARSQSPQLRLQRRSPMQRSRCNR